MTTSLTTHPRYWAPFADVGEDRRKAKFVVYLSNRKRVIMTKLLPDSLGSVTFLSIKNLSIWIFLRFALLFASITDSFPQPKCMRLIEYKNNYGDGSVDSILKIWDN